MSALTRLLRMALRAAGPIVGIALQIDDATRRQYNEILEREHKGGRISQQERALLMSVYPKLNPPRDSVGMTALTTWERVRAEPGEGCSSSS
jgi:hypothetical protein